LDELSKTEKGDFLGNPKLTTEQKLKRARKGRGKNPLNYTLNRLHCSRRESNRAKRVKIHSKHRSDFKTKRHHRRIKAERGLTQDRPESQKKFLKKFTSASGKTLADRKTKRCKKIFSEGEFDIPLTHGSGAHPRR